MPTHKLIFAGPTGAGKTTAIHAICDSPPLAAKPAPVKNQLVDSSRDFGILKLMGKEKVELHEIAMPGKHISLPESWLIDGIGLIILLDNTRDNPFKDMWFYLDAFKDFIAETQVAIGITNMDRSLFPSIAEYHAQLKLIGLNPPVFTVDARIRDDVSILVQALLYSLNPWLPD